jgi:hypothetical protein
MSMCSSRLHRLDIIYVQVQYVQTYMQRIPHKTYRRPTVLCLSQKRLRVCERGHIWIALCKMKDYK